MFTYGVWEDFVISEYKRSYSEVELFDIVTAIFLVCLQYQ